MTADDFRVSLTEPDPPGQLHPLLAALWWDAKGDWDRAHAIAQDGDGPGAAWVHAYLHRKEGDEANAGYWYGQAKRPHCVSSLEKEWEQIVIWLLARG